VTVVDKSLILNPKCEKPRLGRPVSAGQDPAKRDQILAGAQRVFFSMGFDAASMSDITREAGVSKGTIYVYFTSKEELFEALMDNERNKMFSSLTEVLEQATSLRQALTDYGRLFTGLLLSDKGVKAHRIMLAVVERKPEFGARFYERGPRRGFLLLRSLLEGFVAKGQCVIDDLDMATYQFSELCLAKFFRQRLFGYQADVPPKEDVEHVILAAVDVFMKAYGREDLGGTVLETSAKIATV
jgi:AcrR family transcriptional regulator